MALTATEKKDVEVMIRKEIKDFLTGKYRLKLIKKGPFFTVDNQSYYDTELGKVYKKDAASRRKA